MTYLVKEDRKVFVELVGFASSGKGEPGKGEQLLCCRQILLTDPHSRLFLILISRFICIIPVEALVLIRKKEGRRQRVAFFVFLFQIFLENYQFIALDYFLKKSSQLGKGG